MAGQMGAGRVTTLNLEVVKADVEREMLLIRALFQGPGGGW
jgi:large subunit ribosomal protein L3